MSPANSSSTTVVDHACVEALMDETSLFISQLTVDIDIAVHQRIDQFFYMEKNEELRILNEQIDELQARINLMQTQRNLCYAQVKEQMKADASWLQEYRKHN
jgi:hypothetical protein